MGKERRDSTADAFSHALVYVVRALGEVGVTKLEKILYLADLEHFRRTGRTITGAKWLRYKLGPLAKRLPHVRDALAGHEITVSAEVRGGHSAQVYRPGPDRRFELELCPDEVRDLDRVVSMARHLSTDEAIALAYNTSPMRFLLMREQGTPRWNVPVPFELEPGVVAAAATKEHTVRDPEERAAFKRAELDRAADLQESALATLARRE
jgi:hypothetical protein